MKINELRIGDWYKSVKFGDAVKCDLSDLYDLCAKSDGAYNDPPIDEMFEPIPLTEEWLLKFGFENIGGYLWNCRELGENRFINNPYGITHFEIKGHYEKKHIQYVHQLQNLYWCLCGKELEINL